MNMQDAIAQIKDGAPVRREGWREGGEQIQAQFPNPDTANSLPYIYMHTATGERVPYALTNQDLFAEDWELAV